MDAEAEVAVTSEVGRVDELDGDDVSGIWRAFSWTGLSSNFCFCVQQ